MNKLRVLLVAAALLTAACGTATISGTQVKSISSSGTVRVDAGANAGTTVAGDDLSRPNPPIHRGGTVPAPQSQSPTTNATQPSIVGHDRCSDGFPASTAAGTRNSAGGKRLPLPMCAVQ
jgi:predicted small secreted protein